MAYTALYRKWRPDSFENLVGQDHIVKTLKNQIMANRIGHAYLFSGTRGTGKTSTAKIFAKAVNCENPQDGSPCNTCRVCTMQNGQNMNIIEIDAASNNGVDNIREIREEVRYTPTEGKYKVYIIDEVHMLSQGAFNALLKTLEEPPSHVIFILATTEPHKLPATILSRCQRYDFKRITTNTVADTLMKYMEQEGISAESAAIRYIAKAADGSMRDALSILDQCIAFYLGEEITLTKVLEVLGAVDNSVFSKTIDALSLKNVKVLLDIIEEISVQGRDLSQWVVDLVQYLRNLLIVKSCDEPEAILELSQEDLLTLKNQSAELHSDEIIYYIKKFSELEQKIKFSSQKRVLIEIELIKLCNPEADESNEGILNRITDIEKKLASSSYVPEVKQDTKELNAEEIKALEQALPQDIREAMQQFHQLVKKMEGLDKAILTKVTPAHLGDDFLYLICENEIQKNRLVNPDVMNQVNKNLEEIHGKQFKIKVLTEQEYGHLAHEVRNTTRGVEEASGVFELLKSKINFDIQVL